MKKLKYLFWITLVVFIGLLVYQNLGFFSSKHILRINLLFYESSTPELATGAIIAIFVGISVLIMMMLYFTSRYEVYRAKKTIKELRAGMEESAGTISKLNQEVEMLKSGDQFGPSPNLSISGIDTQAETVNVSETETSSTPQT